MELNMVAGSAERCWDKYARLEGSRCEDRGCSALAARLYALLLSVDGGQVLSEQSEDELRSGSSRSKVEVMVKFDRGEAPIGESG
jgi:hypothetical protein